MTDAEQLNHEFDNEFHLIYDELKKLEMEFPNVARNQDSIADRDYSLLVNTYAALLHSAQETQDEASPAEIRQALQHLGGVVGFREATSELVAQLFPMSVIIIEKLYFQNRSVKRYLSIDPVERADGIGKVDLREWTYPDERIEALRDLVRQIWRDDVLETTEIQGPSAHERN